MTKSLEHNPAPRGSSFYYSLLGLDHDRRQALIHCQALVDEIRRISERYREPEIAQVKLNWWREEIDRLYQHKPSHPIAQNLTAITKQFALPSNYFQALIESAVLSVTTDVFANDNILQHHYQHTGGLPEIIKAHILSSDLPNQNLQLYAQRQGIALEIMRHISYFHTFSRQNKIYLAQDQLEQQGLSPEQMLTDQNWQQLPNLLKQQAELARSYHEKAQALLTSNQQAEQRAGRLYAYLKLKQLAKLEKLNFPIASRQVKLSPLTKVLISFSFA